MTYNFKTQLSFGEAQEKRIDEYLGQFYEIKPATRAEQRLGIDRHFTDKKSGRSFTVEYKADRTAGRTGNAFVEMVSVDKDAKPGWALTSHAVYLCYLVVDPAVLYVLTFEKIRNHLIRWVSTYKPRVIPNDGYNTIGILVPLVEFERHAVKVFSM